MAFCRNHQRWNRQQTPLYLIRGKLTGVRYRDEIVRPIIIPTLRAMGRGSCLQDDNATPHRAVVVRDFLQRQQVVRMDWPARSPDLAPIENLWDILGRRGVDNHPHPTDAAQLFQFLQQEWHAIPQEMLQNLVHSMGVGTPLYLIRGKLTGVRYRDEIVRPIIIPTLRAMGRGSCLQDDNATPHRAVVVRDFLQRQQVVRMDWPARSPDLAPIENLWDILGRRGVDNHPHPTDAAQLFQFLQQEWHAIPQEMLQNLVHSMRQRVPDCLAANGGHTSY
nr:hypothetical protein BaRGS_029957 [Batillaria attramentaria]